MDFVDGSNAVLKSHWWILLFWSPVINIFLPSVLKLIPVPWVSWFLTASLAMCDAAATEFEDAPSEIDMVLFSSTVAVLFSAVGALTPTIVMVIVAVVLDVSLSSSVNV